MKKNPFNNKAIQFTKKADTPQPQQTQKVQKGKDLRTSKK